MYFWRGGGGRSKNQPVKCRRPAVRVILRGAASTRIARFSSGNPKQSTSDMKRRPPAVPPPESGARGVNHPHAPAYRIKAAGV